MQASTAVPASTPVPPSTLRDAIARRLRASLDAWLPASCAVCGAHDRDGLCADCERELPGRSILRCPRCGLAVVLAVSPAVSPAPDSCAACRAHPPAYDATIVLADYSPPLDRVVQALKFGRDASLATPLGRCLARSVDTRLAGGAPSGAVVTAVPLSIARLADRGFNQSLEIGRALAHALALPLDAGALQRVRDTAPASTLHAGERHRALRGAFRARAFAPRSDAGGKRTVLVVDDVMTTGATLQAAAEALRAAGAGFVVNCVVARTPAADDPRRPRSP